MGVPGLERGARKKAATEVAVPADLA